LPQGVIRVLNRQVGQPRRIAQPEGAIALAELSEDHSHGPPVGDDVVHEDQERVFLGSGAHEESSKQRAGRQVERLRRHLGDVLHHRALPLGRRQCREVHDREREGRRRRDQLAGLTAIGGERGAQRFVAGDDRIQRSLERFEVQRAGEMQDERDAVQRRIRLELVQEPEPLLSERERDDVSPRPTRNLAGPPFEIGHTTLSSARRASARGC
jgi:hypothetical protein